MRVPHPRLYAMPRSKKIENDTEEAEIYSVSMTHQLHCLVGSFLSLCKETGDLNWRELLFPFCFPSLGHSRRHQRHTSLAFFVAFYPQNSPQEN